MALLRNKLTKLNLRPFSTKVEVKIPKATDHTEPPMDNVKVHFSVAQDATSLRSLSMQKPAPKKTYEPEMSRTPYYKCPTEPVPTKELARPKMEKRYGNFMVSPTYKNVTLPLKLSKLAKPFPDPVSVMTSHTISDQEKAEQMLAESRFQDFYRKQ